MKDSWNKKRVAIFVCRYVIPPVAVLFLMVVGPLRFHGSFELHWFEWAVRLWLAILTAGTSYGTGNLLAGTWTPEHLAYVGGSYISTPPKLIWILIVVPGLTVYYVGSIFCFTLAVFFGLPDLLLWSVPVGFIAASLSATVFGWRFYKLYQFLYE